ncbi:hypothetical protein N9Q98_00230 [bacterium]|nr:hypothetical protein [bacterium]
MHRFPSKSPGCPPDFKEVGYRREKDLVTWADVTSPILVNEVLDNTTQTKQVSQRLSDPFTSDPRRFLRVRMFR